VLPCEFYSHLSDDERDQIAILRAGGQSMGAIARALGRAKTTISRELQRNALPSGGYSPFMPPEPICCARGVKRSSTGEPLRLFVGDRLAEMDARTDLRLVEVWQRTAAVPS
jgi:IS30 family transposase